MIFNTFKTSSIAAHSIKIRWNIGIHRDFHDLTWQPFSFTSTSASYDDEHVLPSYWGPLQATGSAGGDDFVFIRHRPLACLLCVSPSLGVSVPITNREGIDIDTMTEIAQIQLS